MRVWITVVAALVWLPGLVMAASDASNEAFGWLQKMANAARQTDYQGIYIYQSGGQVETARITHLFDETGEHEKVEALDQMPRELVRNNDDVICYFPDTRHVVAERRKPKKSFPALLPVSVTELGDNYNARLGGQERISGFDCQVVVLEPRDGMRYGYRFWADQNSGLIIRAMTIGEKGEPLDQYTFTQLSVGARIDKEQLKPRLAGKRLVWRNDPAGEIAAADSQWGVRQLPSGFRKVSETRRNMPGKKTPVTHSVFSDGLATVSLFVEPLEDAVRRRQGPSGQGAINVYARTLPEAQITVLGEVPAAAVKQIAHSVTRK